MKARITGDGTSRIEIDGVPALKVPSTLSCHVDRIEAGTYILAAAMTKNGAYYQCSCFGCTCIL